MFRLAIKQVRHNPKRLLLTAFAVALGVSLVAASFTFTNGLSSGFTGLFSEIYGGQDVIVEPDPDAQEESDDPFAAQEGLFTDGDVEAINAVDGVELAMGGLQVTGAVLPAGGVDPDAGFGGGGAPSQLFNWTGVEAFDLSTIVDGRGPEANGEMVLDIDSPARFDYELGDSVLVATEAGIEEFTLVGTIRFGESNSLQGATLGFFTTEDAKRLADDPNFSVVGVITEEGASADAVVSSLQEMLPDGARAITGVDKAAEQAEELDELFQYVNIFAIVFALIALFVGGYIIVNTFRIIVTQRTREIGLLRAIGVSGAQVRTMIMLEALVVAIIATTIGIALGYLLALAMAGIVSLGAGDIFGTLVVPPMAILLSYVLGILVTLIAALMPAIHASNISPMEALRESATGGKKPLRMRNIVGGALALLGAVTVTVGLYAGLERPYIYVGVGAVLLVLGVTLLAAQVLVPMAYGLRGVLSSWFGVDGRLAANNIRREPRRSANTAAALMIGVMLLALVATFTESLKAVATEQFSQTKADFFVLGTAGAIPPGAIDVIEGVDGVDFVTSMGVDSAQFDGAGVSVASVEPDTAHLAFEWNTDREFSELDGGVFIDISIQEQGIEIGDEVTLEGPEGTVTLPVTGLYLNAGDANFWVDESVGTELFGEYTILQSLVMLEDSADPELLMKDIQEALAETFPFVLVQAPGDLEQFVNQALDLILGFISALLSAALVIAILGVANTLLLSVTERTREIGLLRAVGLKKSSVWRMITVESMVMAIFGTILGMILGVSLGAALVLALEDFGFTKVTVPWVWLGVYTLLAAVAGVLAAIWPAWRASRMDILKAIAADG
jgi:putative ABC transport system permease protein